tara:strand:+ start:85 stop:594 length:510 start_codon:yes stop_codon:yes gene_type:complete
MKHQKTLSIIGITLFVVLLLTFSSTLPTSTTALSAAAPACSDTSFSNKITCSGSGTHEKAISNCQNECINNCKVTQTAQCALCKKKVVNGVRCECTADDPNPVFCTVTNEKACVTAIYKTNSKGDTVFVRFEQKKDKKGRIIPCEAKGDVECDVTCAGKGAGTKEPWWE